MARRNNEERRHSFLSAIRLPLDAKEPNPHPIAPSGDRVLQFCCTAPPMSSMSKLAVAGGGPGWADLPRDLLESVLARLPVLDRLRFPAVCTAWQSAAAAAVSGSNAPLSSWLMLSFNPKARGCTQRGGGGGDAKFMEARFLSLAEGRAYVIQQPAPAVSDRLCVGSSADGWLVTADASLELHLLNPVTRAQVPLPSVATKVSFLIENCGVVLPRRLSFFRWCRMSECWTSATGASGRRAARRGTCSGSGRPRCGCSLRWQADFAIPISGTAAQLVVDLLLLACIALLRQAAYHCLVTV
jgi:hypothetical protein